MRDGERLSTKLNEALKRELEAEESLVWWGMSLKDKYRAYFITDRRAIIIEGPVDFEIRSYYSRDICNVRCGEGERANDVIFAQVAVPSYKNDSNLADIYFADVDDPSRVREELQALANKYAIENVPPAPSAEEQGARPAEHVHPKRFANLSCLSNKTRQWVEGELEPGERILWFDKPLPRLFSDGALGTFFIGIFLCGLVILAAWLMTRGGSTNFSMFTKIAFVAFSVGGCYMLLVPPLNYLDYKRFLYVLTNRRFLVFYSRGSKKVFARSYDRMERTWRKERGNGTGDVLLEWASPGMVNAVSDPACVGLESIFKPQEVERLLRTLIQKPQERDQMPAANFGLQGEQNATSGESRRKVFSFSRLLGFMSWLGVTLAIFGAMYGVVFMSPIFMKMNADYLLKQSLYSQESLTMIYAGTSLIGLSLLLLIIGGIVNIAKEKPVQGK